MRFLNKNKNLYKICCAIISCFVFNTVALPYNMAFATGKPTNSSSGSSTPSEGEMNTEALTSMGFQMMGGIPIGGSTKYSYTSSEGMKNAYAVCYTSNPDPELYGDVEVTCVAYAKGGWFIPPYQSASLDTSKSGTTSVTLNFNGVKRVPDGTGYRIEPIRLTAKVTASVYDGTSTLGDDPKFENPYGDDDKNKGSNWTNQTKEDNGGGKGDGDPKDPNDPTGGDGGHKDPNDPKGGDGGHKDPNDPKGGDGGHKDPNDPTGGGGAPTDPTGTNGDGTNSADITPDSSLESVLGGYNGSSDDFNAGDFDWASSDSEGGLDDLDDYFNNSLSDLLGLGENADGLTTDLGLSDFADSSMNMNDLAEMLNNGTISQEDYDALQSQYGLNAGGGDGYGNFNGYGDFNGGFYGDPMSEEAMFDSALDILNSMDKNAQSKDSGTMMDSLINEFFGKDNSIISQFAPDTMTDQELFDLARRLLSETGFSLEDILKGKNYDSGSAYTDEKDAWDMNRITTLIKNKKIKLPDDELTKMNKLRAEKKSALTKAINETKAPKVQVN